MRRGMLIDMPFANIASPSLPLGLLKSLMLLKGWQCQIAPLNLAFAWFAQSTGLYRGIAQQRLLGDWLFARDLFGKCSTQTRHRIPNDKDTIFAPSGRQFLDPEEYRVELEALRESVSDFLDWCVEAFDWRQCDLIGFSSRFSQQVASLALARRLRTIAPDALIAFGGSNCRGSLGSAVLQEFPFVDWVFDGEAENSLTCALDRVAEKDFATQIPGLRHRTGAGIVDGGTAPPMDLDALPYPDYDDYFHAIDRWPVLDRSECRLPLEFSRGCWARRQHGCVFCGMNGDVRQFRSKSPERAYDEVRDITTKYDVFQVFLTDSLVNPAHFKKLYPRLARWGGLRSLFVEVRTDMPRQHVQLLRDAGVEHLQPGIESLDTRMLECMEKGTNLLQNIATLKWARQFGIRVGWHLLADVPGEDAGAYSRMTSIIPLIAHLEPPLDLGTIGLQRSSPLFEEAERRGLRNVRAHRDYAAIYPLQGERLARLAFFFDYDFEWDEERCSGKEKLKHALSDWWSFWALRERPLLAFRCTGGLTVVYDTRLMRRQSVTTLTVAEAAVYGASAEPQSFDEISLRLQKSEVTAGYDHQAIRNAIDTLVGAGLMLRDEDQYLSLAVDLDVLDAYEPSILTRLVRLAEIGTQ